MTSTRQTETIERLLEAVQAAQEAVDRLPLSVPSPLKDHLFGLIVDILMEGPKDAYHCGECGSAALAMSLNALGWEDRATPRPASPSKRMEVLIEQMGIALAFLNATRHKGNR